MLHFIGFIAVLALALMGCSETTGTGGSGGDGGVGGGGEGGTGGGTVACTDNLCPCSEAGIRAAIAEGGERDYRFDCGGPTTVEIDDTIVIDSAVVLDGEGLLTLDGGGQGFDVVRVEARGAELHRFRLTGASVDEKTLTLADKSVFDKEGVDLAVRGGAVATLGTSTVSSIVNGGRLMVFESTVSNGEGVFNDGDLTMLSSTVSAIRSVEGSIGSLTNCTVSGDSEGGLFLGTNNTGSSLTVAGSIINGGCDIDPGSTLTSKGYNIESLGNTCGFDQTGDQSSVTADDLKLGELSKNGGLTQTHALGAGSVAIDQIPEDDCLDADGVRLTNDQRGVSPPQGSACDVGAVEQDDYVTDCTRIPNETPCWHDLTALGTCFLETCYVSASWCTAANPGTPCEFTPFGDDTPIAGVCVDEGEGQYVRWSCAPECSVLEVGDPCLLDLVTSEMGVCGEGDLCRPEGA